MVTRADVMTEAESWRGTPFQHQGRSEHGVDCAGLVVMVGRALGLLTPEQDFTVYGRVPRPEVMRGVLGSRGKPVPWRSAQIVMLQLRWTMRIEG